MDGDPFPRTVYLCLWWHLQKPFVALFEDGTEAGIHSAARNGVVIEVEGRDVAFGRVDDYWRRDDDGNPMPAEWRTTRSILTAV